MLSGQPKYVVGQPQNDNGCPTGQPIFKTNVKPCRYSFTEAELNNEQ